MCGLLWTAENVVSSWAKEGFDDLGQISGASTFEAGESPPVVDLFLENLQIEESQGYRGRARGAYP